MQRLAAPPTLLWRLALLLVLLAAPLLGRANSGIYGSFIILNPNGTGNAYYDLSSASSNPDFNGANLGTFAAGQTLTLNGAEVLTFKNGSDDITGAALQYRIYPLTGATGAFQSLGLNFGCNNGDPGCTGTTNSGDQKWTTTNASLNVLQGLTSGTYVLEAYTTASYTYSSGSGTHTANNSGNNYRATFTVGSVLLSESFESGLGAFTAVNGAVTNKWVQGTGAGASQGTGAAYIANSGTTYAYSNSNATTYLYTDVTVPAGQSVLQLSFDWKNNGDASGNDFAQVYLSPAGTTLTANTSSSFTAPTGTALTPKLFGLGTTPAYTSAQYTFRVTAGTTYRLVFVWRNDASSAVNPPAAIDNVQLSSRAAQPLSGSYTIDNTLALGGRNFPSFTTAVSALNTDGLDGAVTFNVASGQTFDEAPVTLTATGTVDNGITFQKSGMGNATLRGTGGLSAITNTVDNLFTLIGSDYVTFDGIDLADNPSNTNAGTRMERGLYLNGSSGTDGCQFNTFKNGTISLNSANTSETICVRVFSLASQASGTNSNNKFLNVTLQNATRGYYFSGSSTTLPDENNLIDVALVAPNTYGTSVIKNLSNQTSSSSASVFGVDISAQKNFQVSNTTFQDFTMPSGSVSTTGVVGINATTTGSSFTASNNKFSNLTNAASTTGYVAAIYCTAGLSGQSVTINGNRIEPLGAATASLSSSVATTKLYGIYTTAGISFNIYDNVINTIRQTAATTGGVEFFGIYVSGSGAAHNIYRNYLHTLTQAATSGSFLSGINVAGGTTVNVHDNMLANLRYDAASGSPSVRAVSLSGATTFNFYHNTVYLSGAATIASPQSAALYLPSSATTTIDARNNILVNGYTGGTSNQRIVAVYKASSTIDNPIIATTTNNNLVYGTTGLLFNGSLVYTTLADYRTRIGGGPRELAAVTESTTPFVSATDPHLNPASTQATQAESGGQDLSALSVTDITLDYDKDARGPYPLSPAPSNGGGTAPDIGADEGNFKALDLTAPTIVVNTPLAGIISQSGPTLTNVSITDPSGVATTAGNGRPRLYFKRSTDPNDATGWKFVEADGTGTTSPFAFTLDYSLLTGGGATLPVGTVVQYFVVAQDLAPTPNVGINAASSFAAAPASVSLTSAAFPIGGTPLSFTIQQEFNGTVTVGPTTGNYPGSLNYPTFTTSTGLFQALNAGVVTGPVTVYVTGNIGTEDGTVPLKPLTYQGAGNYAISIQPDGATEYLITGASNSMGAGIVLNGADNVTFDGRVNQTGTDKYLRFRNASSSNPVFYLLQDATGNTIRNCYLEGSSTSASNGIIFLGNSTTSAVNGVAGGVTGNDNNSVLNCDIFRATGGSRPTQAIYSPAPSVTAAAPDNVTISGNSIYDWDTYGIITAGAGNGWTITGNSFYTTATSTATQPWVLNLATAATATGWQVRGNYIGGSGPQAAGTWTGSATTVFRGIYLNGTSTNTTPGVLVADNFIRNITLTGAGSTFAGIEVKADNASYTIGGNVVNDIRVATTQNGGLSGTGLVGILTNGTATGSLAQNITDNTIYNLTATNTSATNNYVVGIMAKTTASSTGTITRNRVYNLTHLATATSTGLIGISVASGTWTMTNNQVTLSNPGGPTTAAIYGLFDGGTSGGSWYFNSVRLSGTATGAKSYALYRNIGTFTMNVRNNVLVNERTGGNGNFAIGVNNLTGVSASHNDLYTATASTLAEVGSTAYSFQGWSNLSGAPGTSSANVAVKFVDPSTGNLSLDATTNCKLDNTGLAISGINGEFGNAQTDRQSNVDLGSDAFVYTQQLAAFTGPTSLAVCPGGSATLTVSSPGNGGPFTLIYSDGTTQTTVSGASGSQTITVPLTGSSTTYSLVRVTDAYTCDLGLSSSAGAVTLNETTSTTWSGAASTDWFDAANWSNCVPSATVDAVVPTVVSANYPSIANGSATVRSIQFANDGRLDMTGGTLNVYQDWTRTGPGSSSVLTGGTVAFVGSGPQQLSAAPSFFNLTVNKATDTLRVAANPTVTGALTMTSGIVKTYTPGTTYQINLAGTLTETATSFVLGNVVTSATLGTDGASSSFGGIGLTLTAHSTGGVNLPGATTVTRMTGKPMYGMSNSTSIRRQFNIQPAIDTNLNVDMVFGYGDSAFELQGISEGNLTLFSNAGVPGGWKQEGYTNRDATANTVTLNGLNHLSLWTLGNEATPLPVSLTSFEATRQGANALLTWTTAQEKNNRGFEVQVSTDGRSFRPLGFVASESPSSTSARHYRFVDAEAGKQGLRYYRLQQLDLDGTKAYFGPRTVQFEQVTKLAAVAFPNPFAGSELTLEVTAPTSGATELLLVDALGRTVLRRTVQLQAGVQRLPLPLTGEPLPSGAYLLRLTSAGQTSTLRVVKQ